MQTGACDWLKTEEWADTWMTEAHITDCKYTLLVSKISCFPSIHCFLKKIHTDFRHVLYILWKMISVKCEKHEIFGGEPCLPPQSSESISRLILKLLSIGGKTFPYLQYFIILRLFISSVEVFSLHEFVRFKQTKTHLKQLRKVSWDLACAVTHG